jgi:ferric-dicitrate binding protein FerR (iron transport regulator)
VKRGEIYGSTAGGRLPAPLALVAPQATARVVGTTFAVFQNSEGTCVCLLEGAVEVRAVTAPQDAIRVPEGHKCFVYSDGRPHAIVPIDDMERMKLDMIRDAASAGRP